MRPVGSAAELERRRRRAVRLVQAGHSLSAVARMVGAAVSAVWQWRETWRRKGEPGLKARPTPGRPPKLTARQRQRLPRLLGLGARRYGYPNDLWTARRIAALIEHEFRVGYHPAQVSRILAQLGFSYQKPERRALERNEAAIAHWKRYRWVEIKKKPGA
jgi:transposase